MNYVGRLKLVTSIKSVLHVNGKCYKIICLPLSPHEQHFIDFKNSCKNE